MNKIQDIQALKALKYCRRAEMHRIYSTKSLLDLELPALEELHITHFPLTSKKIPAITRQAVHLKKLTIEIPIGSENEMEVESDSLETIVIIPKRSVKKLIIKGTAKPVVIGAED